MVGLLDSQVERGRMLQFGKRVRIWRLLRGLSQTELSQASQTRLDQAVIARHESSVTTVPRKKTTDTYAAALRLPVALLTGEEPPTGLQDVFRPLSPWKSLPAETGNRIGLDLKELLPGLCADLGLSRAEFFRSKLGSVVLLAGGAHRVILVLPPDSMPLAQVISSVIADAFSGKTNTSPLSVQLYIALLLDPVGALGRRELPEAVRLEGGSGAADLYLPPALSTGVYLEVAGDRGDIRQRIEACLYGEGVLHLEVHRPEDYRSSLPEEVRKYLARNNLRLDSKGRLGR